MTIIQAAALRVKWKLRVNPAPCEHLNLEAEWSENGPTGNYHCILCGEVVAKKNIMTPFSLTRYAQSRINLPPHYI